jgi:hypothetical protein
MTRLFFKVQKRVKLYLRVHYGISGVIWPGSEIFPGLYRCRDVFWCRERREDRSVT